MSPPPEPPPAASLTYAQYSGWACCWCAKSLLDVAGAVSAGIARGREGVHVLDIEVYACPDCAGRSSRRPPVRNRRGGKP
ncbi:hypothetical protein [Streptomyces shenzhenensis]|uniref:Uncharacterized protein n=1 Tax=Streptomyces shenzhenensis TaxID=943815 RepID=A0A3M0ITY6_9ACTN|nr:hypothetical protein [Streptomyces shenzhenensis]RMB85636.1 hypothetical protein CTZ28_12680 [Streptomyces shenzhenensis]